MVFPELCVTGYTCGDLFAQPLLLQSAEEAVRRLLDSTVDCDALLLVGVPVACGTALYNCAQCAIAAICWGLCRNPICRIMRSFMRRGSLRRRMTVTGS